MSKDKWRLVGYCGCYCGLCTARARVPQHATQLKDTLHQIGMDFWYKLAPPKWKFIPAIKEFPNFSKFLDELTKFDCTCRTGGGPVTCKIRLCARKKGISACPFCDDYPCAIIKNYTKVHPTTIEDGKRLKEIGLEAWVKEQEERAKHGFVYEAICIPRKSSWA